jgi:7-keto-8-aminopelargonate synthetase-like enzyme
MFKLNNQANRVNELYESFEWQQVVQIPVEQLSLDNNHITIHGQDAVHFGSSGYLGLHKDERVIEGGIAAMRKYGALFSSSRSFTYLPLHDEFEAKLEQIFGLPCLATIQTTMAHFSAMQLLMLPQDAAIIDMQAHATLQSMIQLPKAQGMRVELLRHNDLEMLERKIQFLRDKHEKVWYVADGVYSMYGDGAPFLQLLDLLNKYENFYLYIDDAHGTSWTGPNGAGYAWKYMPAGHPKVILATSLGKGFGIGGGVLVCPNKEVKTWMTRAGGSVVFCTQLPPQMLGSGIAAADIHLSSEIYTRQDAMKANIQLFTQLARKYSLPLVDYSETPVFFITVGNHDLAVELNQMVRRAGYYVNLGSYPAVPFKNSGLRISITSEHTFGEITGLVKTLSNCLNELLSRYNMSVNDIMHSILRAKTKVA